MKKIYETREWKGYGKQNYYSNEYTLDNDEVTKYKCHRQKCFDNCDSYWAEDKKEVDSWNVNDPSMPEWLKKYI